MTDRLKKDAKKIASILRRTDTQLRGDLLAEVAVSLKRHGQQYTAFRIEHAAKLYGLKEDK